MQIALRKGPVLFDSLSRAVQKLLAFLSDLGMMLLDLVVLAARASFVAALLVKAAP